MALSLLSQAKSKLKYLRNLCSSTPPMMKKDESKFLVAQIRLSLKRGEDLADYSIISMKDNFPKVEKHVKYPAFQDQDCVLSICNGLLLFLLPPKYAPMKGKKPIFKITKHPGEALWNPTTGEYKILPPPPSNFDPRCEKTFQGYFGFGFDSASEDYKVIRLLQLNDDKTKLYAPNPAVMAELYSLRTNSWKQVSVVHPLTIPRDYGVHINGTYYWLNISNPWFIVSFDFATEKFASSVIPVPPSDKLTGIKAYYGLNAYFDDIKLVEYCGSLGAMFLSGSKTLVRSLENMRSLEIWVWDGSWSLVSTLTVPLFYGLWTLIGTDKLLFLDTHCKPMLFDCATGELKKIESLPACMRMHIYPFVESYVPLDG